VFVGVCFENLLRYLVVLRSLHAEGFHDGGFDTLQGFLWRLSLNDGEDAVREQGFPGGFDREKMRWSPGEEGLEGLDDLLTLLGRGSSLFESPPGRVADDVPHKGNAGIVDERGAWHLRGHPSRLARLGRLGRLGRLASSRGKGPRSKKRHFFFNKSPEEVSLTLTMPAPRPERAQLLVDKHRDYIVKISKSRDSFEYYATEHFRLSGIYWGLCALYLMGEEDALDREELISWVLSCQKPEGGFGASERNDCHILPTLSAVQILAMVGRLDLVDADKVVGYVAGLQQEDGSFYGDYTGEVDTRFIYAALACLKILGRLEDCCDGLAGVDGRGIDVGKAVEYIVGCQNFDGGYGATPGNESHAGQVFTCVAALQLAGALDKVDADLLCWWLAERQTASGGLNGRPEKLQDVCYSWWCLSSLSILKRLHWIDQDRLVEFILDCQDEIDGGISDRPEDQADVYHTFFGLAGISLLGRSGLKPIDPTLALPCEVVDRLCHR
jgi:geranylgeranyl transferase type-2 subunit beta